jgi:hypothetical protein
LQYDLYGTKVHSAEDLTEAVGGSLGLGFTSHVNQKGAYFPASGIGDEVFEVQENKTGPLADFEPLEADYIEWPVLLTISRTTRGDEIRERVEALEGVKFLRRESL